MSGETALLFVYGTLKRGDVRASLLNGQRFISTTRTRCLYRLFNAGTYPALVEAKPLGLAGLAIEGELWQVEVDRLAKIDEEEGVGEGLYERRVIALDRYTSQAESYFYLPSVRGMDDCGQHW